MELVVEREGIGGTAEGCGIWWSSADFGVGGRLADGGERDAMICVWGGQGDWQLPKAAASVSAGRCVSALRRGGRQRGERGLQARSPPVLWNRGILRERDRRLLDWNSRSPLSKRELRGRMPARARQSEAEWAGESESE